MLPIVLGFPTGYLGRRRSRPGLHLPRTAQTPPLAPVQPDLLSIRLPGQTPIRQAPQRLRPPNNRAQNPPVLPEWFLSKPSAAPLPCPIPIAADNPKPLPKFLWRIPTSQTLILRPSNRPVPHH